MPYALINDDYEVIENPSKLALSALAKGTRVESLLIFDYALSDLNPLRCFTSLKKLKLQVKRENFSLAGCANLNLLTELVIQTPISWDSSSKRIEVPSFRPLKQLQKLQRLNLLRVRPQDLDIRPLMALSKLKEIDVSGVSEFQLREFTALARALKSAKGRCIQPYYTIPGLKSCRKCRRECIFFSGIPKGGRTSFLS